MELLYLAAGLILGFVIGFLVKKLQNNGSGNDAESQQVIKELTLENGNLKGRIESSLEAFRKIETKNNELEQKNSELISENARLTNAYQNIETKLKEQKDEISQLQEKFTTEFSLIANKLLKQNATEFAQANEKRLSEILNPLKENIQQFEKK